jgi:protein-disulfide isomerase-like protein with CxxC motif
MAKQIAMDATGDIRHEFDPADAAAVAEAWARFKQLTGAGFTAAVRRGTGSSDLIRDFDPAAEETVFFPRLRGG